MTTRLRGGIRGTVGDIFESYARACAIAAAVGVVAGGALVWWWLSRTGRLR